MDNIHEYSIQYRNKSSYGIELTSPRKNNNDKVIIPIFISKNTSKNTSKNKCPLYLCFFKK